MNGPDLNSPTQRTAPVDPVLDAMGGAVGALRRFADHTTEIIEAFDRAARMRESGASYRQIAEKEPLFVDFSTGAFRELYEALSAMRRRQALTLYEEGMTMAQLGRLLGVTRQRIAVLLGDKSKRDTSTAADTSTTDA
jgi:hypothetical protein